MLAMLPPISAPIDMAPVLIQRYTLFTRPKRWPGTSCCRNETARMLSSVVMNAWTAVIVMTSHVFGKSPMMTLVNAGDKGSLEKLNVLRHEADAVPLLEGGERAKNSYFHVSEIQSQVEKHHIDRHSYIIAVGGGALLDVVGLAAAIGFRPLVGAQA